jgi:hypothetical protein
MSDGLCDDLEAELADLALRLTEPGGTECLRCYLLRMIAEFGCDGGFRWAVRWRDVHAARPKGLLRRLAERGCCCDCEVLLNVYPDYPPVARPLPCAGIPQRGSVRPCDLRNLARSG